MLIFLALKRSDGEFTMLIMLKCQQLLEFSIYEQDKFHAQLS